MLLVFRSTGPNRALFTPRSRADISAWRGILTALADQSFLQQFWRRWRWRAVLFRLAAPFRQICRGKNLAHAAILALEVVLVWLGTSLLYRAPSIRVTLATIAGILFALPLDLAAGNLFSIYSPTKIEAGVFGRQRASLTTVLASFGIRGATVWRSFPDAVVRRVTTEPPGSSYRPS